MITTIKVGIIGFSVQERIKLEKIFELSRQHQRCYKLINLSETEPAQLLIVKKDHDSAKTQLQAYQAQYKNSYIAVVSTGREPPAPEDTYYIRGVLVPSRVFAVLDTVSLSVPSHQYTVQAPAAVEKIPPQTPTAVTAAQPEALQVLVVDDSVMMQKTIQLELNKATLPLAVDCADTGEMALEKVKGKKYDFIFLDVMMPGIDGFETCSQIRKLDGMAKTPIIMLTSKTSALDEVKGLMAGCTTYLTKPFEHDEFHKMLERIVHWVKEFNEKK